MLSIHKALVWLHDNEPAATLGGAVALITAVVNWVQTNQITSWRQAVTVGTPLALSYAIRAFVTPTAQVPKKP